MTGGKEEREWLTLGWCVSHDFELAMEVVFQATGFADIYFFTTLLSL